jgi:hypothetical protein
VEDNDTAISKRDDQARRGTRGRRKVVIIIAAVVVEVHERAVSVLALEVGDARDAVVLEQNVGRVPVLWVLSADVLC